MIRRSIAEKIVQALGDTPVVLIHGARQTGKSTLARWIASDAHRATFLTLDDAGVFSAASSDPAGFLAGLDGPVVIDEIQLVPDLFRTIKLEVDHDRHPGRFLLTGSANVMFLPQLSESLAGRMEIHRLWPFSQGELGGVREGFVEALFKSRLDTSRLKPIEPGELFSRALAGGFPEAQARRSSERRGAWFGAYITTILQRDVRNLAHIEGLAQLPRLLSLLATQATSLLNVSNLARSSGIANVTLKRYLTLLEATFLVQTLPAWSGNIRKRLIKTPKVYFNDSGLLAHVLGLEKESLLRQSPARGPLLENFVGMELLKQMTWKKTSADLYYYRTTNGREVNFVIEESKGRMVGIEVKASATVDPADLKGLHDLQETVGGNFHRGVLLYTGKEVIPFGKNLHALPVSALWQLGIES